MDINKLFIKKYMYANKSCDFTLWFVCMASERNQGINTSLWKKSYILLRPCFNEKIRSEVHSTTPSTSPILPLISHKMFGSHLLSTLFFPTHNGVLMFLSKACRPDYQHVCKHTMHGYKFSHTILNFCVPGFFECSQGRVQK